MIITNSALISPGLLFIPPYPTSGRAISADIAKEAYVFSIVSVLTGMKMDTPLSVKFNWFKLYSSRIAIYTEILHLHELVDWWKRTQYINARNLAKTSKYCS